MLKVLNEGTNSNKSNNKENILTGKEITLGKNNPKNIKKVVDEEESDSEPEESQYVPEDTEEDIKYPKIEKKNPAQKRKNNIFEYLNNDAKKNK